ncbi:acyl--CoA ligase [Frankia sp. CNm7]|uniref:Acyl--CoA ligase n=1 Tax=Frankia nepalensis TaxID=1836974 RepID=A0A937UKS0_9ACTN|nr:class I adenylate-forming enzyme family protein [Frankia nepalensis]MBL7501289.1 acyl--CoA ligase [Frankia nepalensis]MBL7510136.1 acyl--CoA ligase [Frankia nepalensis]MBL7520293.1 acyl--CoA ligase [Frankia nepalensis]MBL7627089.1 acyl--CoA ligase [Frankia nepalensis]
MSADPQPLTIGGLLLRAARERAEHEYVVTPTDRLTYAEAERRSAVAARRLLGAGVGKGARVGLFFTNDTEWITWWLAVSRIGALAVPLSTLYAPAEIGKVLRLADVGLLVAPTRVLRIDVAERLEAALGGLAGQRAGRLALPAAPYLRRVALTGPSDRPWATSWDVPGEDDVPGQDGEGAGLVPPEVLAAVENEVTPADLAIMIHTSGSTADPKGVLHTHGTIVRQTSTWPAAVRSIAGTGMAPRILCAMPFFWIGGILAATGALHEPATLLVLPRLEAGGGLDLAERERANGVVGWPAFTQQLREHPTFPSRDLSSAPMLTDGPLDLAMKDVPDSFPIHRSLTESGGGFAFTDIAIVDEAGNPVPAGETGELLIRGVGAMAGYNKRERADVFDADGWYHTGDRVYRLAGDPRLFYVGRATELIKAAGANVSPLEVQAVVESFDDVAQCVVLGLEHPSRGEEVCAVVVAAGGLDLESLASRAREQLSSYKVPTRWILATSAQIPTLPSGKLNRRLLQSLITDGTLK